MSKETEVEVVDEYAVDSPATKEQAEELLKKYYKEHRSMTDPLPKRPNLISWQKKPDGTIVLVDGASGRKLTFAPEEAQAKEQAEEQAEDAEQEALDAEAEAAEAEAQALVAEQKAKAARDKANRTPFVYIDKEAKSFGPKGATEAANKAAAKKKADAEAKAKADK